LTTGRFSIEDPRTPSQTGHYLLEQNRISEHPL